MADHFRHISHRIDKAEKKVTPKAKAVWVVLPDWASPEFKNGLKAGANWLPDADGKPTLFMKDEGTNVAIGIVQATGSPASKAEHEKAGKKLLSEAVTAHRKHQAKQAQQSTPATPSPTTSSNTEDQNDGNA
jgi:hypothetical protein